MNLLKSKVTRISLALLILGLCVIGPVFSVEFQTITVRPGDTLWAIADKYLKNPKRWNVILKYNKLPTQDLTVALPGMKLRIPKKEIKEDLRAATLVEVKRKVSYRKRNKPQWKPAKQGKLLFNGDGLKTREKSSARVEFFGGSQLSITPNSMVILRSPHKADHSLLLKRGTVLANFVRVRTPSALVIPKDRNTKFTAKVSEDLSTRVQVYKGTAEVKDLEGKKSVSVKAGFFTDIKLDQLPTVPGKIPNLNIALNAEIDELSEGEVESLVHVRRGEVPSLRSPVKGLRAELRGLAVGMPVSAYHLQVSKSRRFSKIAFDRTYDAYASIDLKQARLVEGKYWVRVAAIDLLGKKGTFSRPYKYEVGKEEEFMTLESQALFKVMRPESDVETVRLPAYRIMGQAGKDLEVRINGDRVRTDEDGFFSQEFFLKAGPNNFRIEATDLRSNDLVITRKVIYEP